MTRYQPNDILTNGEEVFLVIEINNELFLQEVDIDVFLYGPRSPIYMNHGAYSIRRITPEISFYTYIPYNQV